VVRDLIVRGNAKVSLDPPRNSKTHIKAKQDRKQILQSLKKHIEAMCKDGDAQMVLFTAFDCVECVYNELSEKSATDIELNLVIQNS